ncbi:flavin reductase family protein [Archaeoglobus veneficus]|uniref:Flavin reductase domain protein FMN-binding protein n=1 Tax=Archaeoglobus veneficus (strain DSM 11195 / SNP6) TaxID=693661 RepID=F2KS68_ARCVS|nr:flavin reductase family protein [Archaeoglobus veneficus]AEA48007.1 flavin reductase domain protein FMN-binding protein [Archaeoglobus veneficus SNP6]
MELEAKKYYALLARPVVVITTVSAEGKVNAAPFSFNTPISFSPPLYGFSCNPKHDTWANIQETKEFVVNVAGIELGDAMHILEQKFPRGVNELEKAGLEEVQSKTVKPPRVAKAIAWIECKLHSSYEIGDHIWVVGEVSCAEVKDECWDGVIDVSRVLLHISGEFFAQEAKVTKYRRAKK